MKSSASDNDIPTIETLSANISRLEKELKKINETLLSQNKQPLFVREGGRIIHLDRDEILFLEGYGDYVKIHVTSGKVLLTQISLKQFEERLSEREFCRVHRSYIVSLYHISYIERKRIKIGNNDLIPISDSYLQPLMKRLSLNE